MGEKVGSREDGGDEVDFERREKERLERRTKQEEIDSAEEKADDEDDKRSIFCLLYCAGTPSLTGTIYGGYTTYSLVQL